MIYLELFLSFLQVGLFSIGGGYAALPLIQNQVVTTHGWLSVTEFADVVTLSQMTPGPIALNAATFVGTRVGGGLGAIIATVGVVTPSVIIVMGLAAVYVTYRGHGVMDGILGGLRPAVVGLIGSAALTLILLAVMGESGTSQGLDIKALLVFGVAFAILRRYRPNAIGLMAVCGLVGMLVYGLG
jgi:chromate transporter